MPQESTAPGSSGSSSRSSDSDADRRLRALLDQAAHFEQPAGRNLTALALRRLRERGVAVASVNEVLQALRFALVGVVDLLSRGASAEPSAPTSTGKGEPPNG